MFTAHTPAVSCDLAGWVRAQVRLPFFLHQQQARTGSQGMTKVQKNMQKHTGLLKQRLRTGTLLCCLSESHGQVQNQSKKHCTIRWRASGGTLELIESFHILISSGWHMPECCWSSWHSLAKTPMSSTQLSLAHLLSPLCSHLLCSTVIASSLIHASTREIAQSLEICSLPTVWSWARHLASLSLIIFIMKHRWLYLPSSL